MDEPLEGLALYLWLIFGMAPGVWVCFDFYVLDTLRDMKRDRG